MTFSLWPPPGGAVVTCRRLHLSFHFRLRSIPSPPIFRNSRFTVRCSAPQANHYDNVDKEDFWQRVQLLQRLLDVLITEENYAQAKEINDQLCDLKSQLSEREQLILDKVNSLAKGDINERIQVISELGGMADHGVLPMLMNGLLDSNPLVVLETEKAMWKIFMHSGREDVDFRLKEGLSSMLSNDLPRARDIFSQVISMEPTFAEGWNKRATVNYLLQEYRESIEDCKRTLELNPYHFGAMSGMGLCYAALDDHESALEWFQKAYAMHPGLAQIDKFIKNLKQKLDDKNKEDLS